MPQKDKNQQPQPTDAFEFIGMMAQKRNTKPELEEKEAAEESEIQKSCAPKSE